MSQALRLTTPTLRKRSCQDTALAALEDRCQLNMRSRGQGRLLRGGDDWVVAEGLVKSEGTNAIPADHCQCQSLDCPRSESLETAV